MKLLPPQAHYFFCQANIPRALDAQILQEKAAIFNLKGVVIKDVNEALLEARKLANKQDLIFVGGSNFVVAEIENL